MVRQKENSITATRITCALLFIIFTFTYLYSYQADVLAMAQHVLSEGKTHYNATVGALLITSVLYLLFTTCKKLSYTFLKTTAERAGMYSLSHSLWSCAYSWSKFVKCVMVSSVSPLPPKSGLSVLRTTL